MKLNLLIILLTFYCNTFNMATTQSIYDFEINRLNGEKESLSNYKNTVILVVNTASECGFTPQYEGLQSLYSELKDQGFVVLGFPCNQFGSQEPGEAKDIENFCHVNYGVTFPMFDKIEVNGDNTHPLYQFLKSEKGGILGSSIKWNFTKFLVDTQGNVIHRYAPTTKPEKLKEDILKLL